MMDCLVSTLHDICLMGKPDVNMVVNQSQLGKLEGGHMS